MFVQHAGLYIGAAALVLYCFTVVVERMLKSVKEQRTKLGPERSSTFALEVLAVALQIPARVQLPLLAVLLSLRDACQLFVGHQPQTPGFLVSVLDVCSSMLNALQDFSVRYSGVLGVVILSWFAMLAKGALFKQVCTAVSERQGVDRAEVQRALQPVAEMGSWLVWAAALATSTMVVGVDLKPFVWTGGIGGAVVALASQSFLANIVSGINLFLSRPFVAGDRIKVSGSINVHGIVEAVTYTRTLVRTDQLLPVLVPNKALQEAVIVNESRAGNSPTRNNYFGPRQLNFQFHVPYRHMDQAPQITAGIREWLREECDLVDNRYALYCWVTALGENTAVVTVNVYSTTRGSRSFASFREQVLANVFRIVREHGASVSSYSVVMDFRYDMGSPVGNSAGGGGGIFGSGILGDRGGNAEEREQQEEEARLAPWSLLAPPPPELGGGINGSIAAPLSGAA